jgi:hypothetical protein
MNSTQQHLKTASVLAKLLDRNFKIFGFRFGLDPILGLIPGLGDAVSLALSIYLVWIAVQMRVPTSVISQMLVNSLFDFILGLIPVLGDVSDFVYHANSRNLELLRRYQSAPLIEGQVI